MSEPHIEPELTSRDAYFAALERIVHALTDIGYALTSPDGVALDRGGELNSKKPWCWILSETRRSPTGQRRRIAKVFIRNPSSALVDVHDPDHLVALRYYTQIVSMNLIINFHVTDVISAPLFETFSDVKS